MAVTSFDRPIHVPCGKILRVAHDHPGIGAGAYAARMTRHNLALSDGRRLVVHATDGPSALRLTLLWHHGSPQTGAPLSRCRGRGGARDPAALVRPPQLRRLEPATGPDVASAAADVAAIVDALGLDRFAVMGASGGARTRSPARRSCPSA